MSYKDFVPSKNGDLLTWALGYSSHITATPTDYGLVAGDATTLAGLVTTFQTSLAASTNGATRGKATVLATKTARKNLVAFIRRTARIVQACLTVTDEMRQDLGITIPKERAPIPPPAFVPSIDIKSVSGRNVTVRVHQDGALKRGLPDGVKSILLYSFVGETPPSDPAGWTFQGITTRGTVIVAFDASVPAGSRVWFTASYANERGQTGFGCDAVGTYIAGGSSSPMVMKLAA
jgi:hypothetical protein